MKKIFLMLLAMQVSPFVLADGLNAINDPVMNPCIQRPDLAGCSGNSQSGGQARRVINIPNRWGAIYFNPANRAVGYSENNTKGYQSANKEALESCIKAGGGKNPIAFLQNGNHLPPGITYRIHDDCPAVTPRLDMMDPVIQLGKHLRILLKIIS